MPRKLRALLLVAVIALLAIDPTTQGQEKTSQKQPARKTFAKAEWVDSNKDAPNGTKYQTFASKVLGGDVSYLIYLPPGYDKETRRYPVIYWLHGLGGNQRAGASLFVPHVDEAIRKGTLPPAIVVSVNGMVTSFYFDGVDNKRPVESVIIKDLIPHIEQTYRTIAQREGRMIQGYSMGGFGAGHLAFKYPEVFGSVCVDAGALIRESAIEGPNLAPIFQGDKERFRAEHPLRLVEKNADKIRSKMKIRVGVGQEDQLLARNQELHELLDNLKIDHQYIVVPGVGHNARDYYQKLGAKCLELHRTVFESLASGR